MVRFTSMHPPATEPYACVPQANRCSSKARFVDAALPVLMQAFRLPDQEHCAQPSLLFALRVVVPSTAQSRQIVLQQMPHIPRRCKCLKQTSDGTQPTAGKLGTVLRAQANGAVFKRWQRESILACH